MRFTIDIPIEHVLRDIKFALNQLFININSIMADEKLVNDLLNGIEDPRAKEMLVKIIESYKVMWK